MANGSPNPPGREVRRTICNRDCPDACQILATVTDGRVTQLQGDRAHPVTRGFLCQRTDQFLSLQYGPERLLQPRLRKNGRLEPVAWDEALDFVAAELLRIRDRHGPEAIFHYKSGGSLGMVVSEASQQFFAHFGPCAAKRGDICSGAGEAAQELDFGLCDSGSLSQLELARHIILWGKNVTTSSPHTIPVLKRAQARGAKLTLIDPVHHQTARLCDHVLQPRPASDYALAMAVAQILFARGWTDPDLDNYATNVAAFRALAHQRSVSDWCELADVRCDDAEALASRLRDGPTTILVGWGMARRLHGGAIVRAIDALAVISGNVGKPGAGVSYYFQRRKAFRSPPRPAPVRTLPEPLFGPAVLAADPPILALWITAGNPVAMLPNSAAVAKALATRELTVVVDAFRTDSTELAHVVLPTTTLLEADDLVGAYGSHHLGAARPVVPPPPGVRSDYAIFRALAERVGLDVEALFASDIHAFQRQLLGPSLTDRGITLADLETSIATPGAAEVLFAGRVFATDDRKAHLLDRDPGLPATAPDGYPLQLLSLSTPRSQSSQWSRGAPKPASATVHPAAAAGIADGAHARLSTSLGSIEVVVRHDARQRRDVVLVPKGGHHRDGASANSLTRARLSDIGEGGALYDDWARLEPLA